MQGKNIINVAGYLLNGANNLLWPAVCFNCKEHINENDTLCQICWNELLNSTAGYYCRRCGCDTTPYSIVNDMCPSCQGKELNFDSITRVGIYDQTLRNLILAFKNSHTELNILFAQLANAAFETFAETDQIHHIVPVPLHWKRHFKRGYNQSYLISISLKLKSASINTDLVRIRNTAAQISMPTPKSRLKNVTGAFAVRKDHDFEGKTVLLVDDIKTTGATLNECAKILKQAGSQTVHTLVLAVAGQNL